MLFRLTALTIIALLGIVIGMAVKEAKAHSSGSRLAYSERVSHKVHHTIRATNNCRVKLGQHRVAVRNLYTRQSVKRRRYVLHVWLDKLYACGKELRRQQSRSVVDSCLMEIIRREASGFRPDKPSTWREAATTWNGAGSGAYGVPQALPGNKMASAGKDWATNVWTQVRWMIGYVNGRYGGSCAALAHHNSNGYY